MVGSYQQTTYNSFSYLKIKISTYVITRDLKDKKAKESTDNFLLITLNPKTIGKTYKA